MHGKWISYGGPIPGARKGFVKLSASPMDSLFNFAAPVESQPNYRPTSKKTPLQWLFEKQGNGESKSCRQYYRSGHIAQGGVLLNNPGVCSRSLKFRNVVSYGILELGMQSAIDANLSSSDTSHHAGEELLLIFEIFPSPHGSNPPIPYLNWKNYSEIHRVNRPSELKECNTCTLWLKFILPVFVKKPKP